MRDWSSDVCSSDLGIRLGERPTLHVIPGHADDVARPRQWGAGPHRMDRRPAGPRQDAFDLLAVLGETSNELGHQIFRPHLRKILHDLRDVDRLIRSDEQTSELQSLIRRSYAVFCL